MGGLRRLPSGEQVAILFEPEDIAMRVRQLAATITGALGADFLVIALLKGSFIFAADLLRGLHAAGAMPEVDFLTVSSYGKGQTSSGQPTILRDVTSEVRERPVLIVDDILESGHTLAFVKGVLRERGAQSVHACVLLDKPGKRIASLEADFVGFRCPDAFVIGYGMDLAHRFRELPFIGMLDSSGVPSA